MLATLKGLPLAYNRDLQEDKEPLFDALDTARLALVALTGLLATASSTPTRMRAAADAPTVAATDLAEWLVARGVPFREAHAVVGAIVRQSIERGRAARRAGDDRARASAPTRSRCSSRAASVQRRTTPGGGGPGAVRRAARRGARAASTQLAPAE